MSISSCQPETVFIVWPRKAQALKTEIPLSPGGERPWKFTLPLHKDRFQSVNFKTINHSSIIKKKSYRVPD